MSSDQKKYILVSTISVFVLIGAILFAQNIDKIFDLSGAQAIRIGPPAMFMRELKPSTQQVLEPGEIIEYEVSIQVEWGQPIDRDLCKILDITPYFGHIEYDVTSIENLSEEHPNYIKAAYLYIPELGLSDSDDRPYVPEINIYPEGDINHINRRPPPGDKGYVEYPGTITIIAENYSPENVAPDTILDFNIIVKMGAFPELDIYNSCELEPTGEPPIYVADGEILLLSERSNEDDSSDDDNAGNSGANSNGENSEDSNDNDSESDDSSDNDDLDDSDNNSDDDSSDESSSDNENHNDNSDNNDNTDASDDNSSDIVDSSLSSGTSENDKSSSNTGAPLDNIESGEDDNESTNNEHTDSSDSTSYTLPSTDGSSYEEYDYTSGDSDSVDYDDQPTPESMPVTGTESNWVLLAGALSAFVTIMLTKLKFYLA